MPSIGASNRSAPRITLKLTIGSPVLSSDDPTNCYSSYNSSEGTLAAVYP